MESELHPEEATEVQVRHRKIPESGSRVVSRGFSGRRGVEELRSGLMPRMALASVSCSCAQHRARHTETPRSQSWSPSPAGYLTSCSWSACSSSSCDCSSCSWRWACSFASRSPYVGSWGKDGQGRVGTTTQLGAQPMNFPVRL